MEQVISSAQADIIDVTAQNFMAEVIEASQNKAVIIQFWAPWCGPCKQLGPVLEKVISGQKNIRLARVNIDENQQIAAQMRVQSVPTVFALIDGRPVDGFAGAQPESAVKQFVEKLAQMAPGAADIAPLLEAGQAALEQNNAPEALSSYQQALALVPESLEALSGLIRSLVQMGEVEQAREVLDHLEEDRKDKPELRDAISAVEIAEKGAAGAGEIDQLRQAFQQNPDDLETHQSLAMALYGAGQAEEAMSILLLSVKKDASFDEGAAKAQLLEFFTALGAAHPAVIKARRKLSTYLFS